MLIVNPVDLFGALVQSGYEGWDALVAT